MNEAEMRSWFEGLSLADKNRYLRTVQRATIAKRVFEVSRADPSETELSGFRQGEDSCSDAAWKYAQDHNCSVDEANRILRSRR